MLQNNTQQNQDMLPVVVYFYSKFPSFQIKFFIEFCEIIVNDFYVIIFDHHESETNFKNTYWVSF